jgi:Tfp pilus assembly protein PilF
MIDGRPVEGRFITEYAYALYAIAADAEAHGDLATALQAFEAAAVEDDESPQIWTRIGGLRCRISGQASKAAEAFDRARELDADYEPLSRERAICALRRGRLAEAQEHAARSVELDPNSEEPALLRASIAEAAGKRDEARRALHELVIRRPMSLHAWRALHALAIRMNDAITSAHAAAKLEQLTFGAPLSQRFGDGPSPEAGLAEAKDEAAIAAMDARSSLMAIDAALAAGDLPQARRLGRRARILPSELAVRAAALGRADVARAQAELVLGADPSESSARIALAVAADLGRDAALLERALTDFPTASGPPLPQPSPLARLLFAELLERRASAEAARLWLGPEGLKGAPDPSRQGGGIDPMLARVDKRVRERLAAPAKAP